MLHCDQLKNEKLQISWKRQIVERNGLNLELGGISATHCMEVPSTLKC